MKKVAIITFIRSYSYGALLQAYALYKIISNLGFQCCVLDYGNIGKSRRFILTKKNLRLAFQYMKINLISIPFEDIRRRKFAIFRKKFIATTNERYLNKDDLRTVQNSFDYFVAGSDQVWNPLINKGDTSYLLDFVDESRKKIAYAPSFGISKLPESCTKMYAKLISSISYLSIRENIGKKIINELTGYKAKVVLDPTLLLNTDEWDKIVMAPKINAPYIFCFTLQRSRPEMFEIFVKQIAYLTGYKVISVGGYGYSSSSYDKVCYTAGPRELLGFIKYASIVVTTSFHGTIFSILYKKPFFTFLDANKQNVNSRLLELARKFELEDRFFSKRPKNIATDSFKIDYSEVFKIIEDERAKSINYLVDSLSNS